MNHVVESQEEVFALLANPKFSDRAVHRQGSQHRRLLCNGDRCRKARIQIERSDAFHADLTDPADLVEEVVRLSGYDDIPSVLPTAPPGRGLTDVQRSRRAIGRALAEFGYVEAPAYPFIGAPVLDSQGDVFGVTQFGGTGGKGVIYEMTPSPAGYTEHSDYPVNYGAWYISQVLDILVSKPEVFSKTVFIVNYDEADGSFDHIVPPSPPATVPATADVGASTVDYHNEIVTTSTPNGPIGLGTRVPCIVISPWSKGGYVNSQVFDHTSTIQFIEKRFGVYERNISPWRRAVCGDLTSVFNFRNPDQDADDRIKLPSTAGYLPPVGELAGTANPPDLAITTNNVIIGIPAQEKGIRPARALPYDLNVYSKVSSSTVELQFVNRGKAGAVFQVRSGSTTDPVRNYTVEAGKTLSGSWTVAGSYDLTVYGPNGFMRAFKGSVGLGAVVLDVRSEYADDEDAVIFFSVRNAGSHKASVTVLDAYTGEKMLRMLGPNGRADARLPLSQFHGWYDLVVTVAEDPNLECRLAGHVETGSDSMSDPAMGGLLTLKA